jgi:choline monooxygenase
MLPKQYYADPSHLSLEVEKIFKSSWIFVGLEEELVNNHDFVCTEFFGASIVVQNFSGSLRAFQNICPHRFNPLQYERQGNRPLICRYHYWRFDEHGSPLGNVPTIAPGAQDSCLKKYRVQKCGKFVFVAMNDEVTDLQAFLGGFFETLENLSGHIGSQISSHEVPHAANWKLLVENVLECYHCNAVHPETFVKGLGVGRMPIQDVVFASDHSSCHFPRMATESESKRKHLLKHLESRAFHHNSFYHLYIFPNLFISSTEGSSFYIGSALPTAANRTTLVSRFLEPQVTLTGPQRRKQNLINEHSVPLGLRVIDEDRIILEKIQSTISIVDFEGCLAEQEIRLARFEASYLAKLR